MRDPSTGVPGDRRASFEAHGWVVLRGVVSEPDLSEMNRIFDDQMTALAEPAAEGRSRVVQRPNACRTNDVLLRHLGEGLAEIACDLLGAQSVQLLQDVLLLKPPSLGGSIALHQDYSYTGYLNPPSSLSIGLALNDATLDSGCLYVVDASHTWGLVGGLDLFADALQKDVVERLSPEQRDHVDRRMVPLEVRAGDVTIHHCLTLHGSGENRSGRPRKTIVTHLFNSDCRLVRERLPVHLQDHFTTDDRERLAGPAFPTLYRAASDRGAGAPGVVTTVAIA